jgi:hypothetical protein
MLDWNTPLVHLTWFNCFWLLPKFECASKVWSFEHIKYIPEDLTAALNFAVKEGLYKCINVEWNCESDLTCELQISAIKIIQELDSHALHIVVK